MSDKQTISDEEKIHDIKRTILPYSCIVGQEQLKLALELAYIAPRIGGVLLSGKRGTAKSTIARAFAVLMYDSLPITIPINATEDRVVGGWSVHELLQGKPKELPGLLRQANENLLYIDEVNLLDNHIVNIILDVISTGKLVVQREGLDGEYDVRTTLVGTMNPEEGNLRPQLLDRFGLMVDVETLNDSTQRGQILKTVLDFERALQQERLSERSSPWLEQKLAENRQHKRRIEQAQERFVHIEPSASLTEACVRIAVAFDVDGHRSDYLLALAACAYAALQEREQADVEDLLVVAELVLRHRQAPETQGEQAAWGREQRAKVENIIYA